ADLLDVLHAGDTGDHRAEDHRGDDHLDQFDEAVSQRLHRGGQARIIDAQQDTDNNREQYLDIKDFIEWFFHDEASCAIDNTVIITQNNWTSYCGKPQHLPAWPSYAFWIMGTRV